jgi:hypothetical protein
VDRSPKITFVSAPHFLPTHCSAVQATILSTRGRSAEKVCRPGCARRFSPSGAGNPSRSLSA